MRNLSLLASRSTKINEDSTSSIPVQGRVLFFVVDSERKNAFFITDQLIFYGLKLENGQIWLELVWGGESEEALFAVGVSLMMLSKTTATRV